MDSALPGFEMDWTVALEQYAQNHDGRNFFEDMMPVLQSIYPGARFTPQYAGSFADVLAFSRQPGHTGVRLGKLALKHGKTPTCRSICPVLPWCGWKEKATAPKTY